MFDVMWAVREPRGHYSAAKKALARSLGRKPSLLFRRGKDPRGEVSDVVPAEHVAYRQVRERK